MIEFVYKPPEDEGVDPDYELHKDGKFTNISIQDCRAYGGGFAVNRFDGEGATFTLETVGSAKSLKKAKLLALRILGDME